MSKEKAAAVIVAHRDFNGRTCIEVNRAGGVVKFIPLDVDQGLVVCEKTAQEFDRHYKAMIDYPPHQAAKLYVGYSETIGATKEALDYLGKFTTITPKGYDMAFKKMGTKAAEDKVSSKVAAKKAPAKKAPVKPAAKAASKKAPAKAAAKAPAKKVAAKTGEKKSSAAQMFKDLIMAGKLTDDQIFAQVQTEFGLDDKKRSYVTWYRNYLTKEGKNPPKAK